MSPKTPTVVCFAVAFGIWTTSLVAWKPGDVATGEIVSDDGDTLQLNTTPCGDSPHMVTFVKPWKVGKRTPKTCPLKGDEKEAKSYVEVDVQQLDQPPAPKPVEQPTKSE